mmetsp:Transcript_60603/g.161742  ORF Transcript_60603/g.161742 Transcript_60603/m.161742 type:complete len:397 (+) Transcript_60603:843-2033(+)
MAADAPPPAKQQQRLLGLALARDVLGADHARRRAPDGRLASALAELDLLVVAVPVDPDAEHAGDGEGGGGDWPERDRVGCEKEAVRRVERRHEHQATVADVVSRAVVLDVHSVDVAHLPGEELENVHLLNKNGDEESIGDIAKLFVLVSSIRQEHDSPDQHSETAVCELLDVPANRPHPVAEAGVQFGAPPIVENEVASTATIASRRCIHTLQVESEAKDDREYVQSSTHRERNFKQHSSLEQTKQRANHPHNDRGQKRSNSVCLVSWTMPRRRNRANVVFSRQKRHENKLQGHEAKCILHSMHHLRNRRVHANNGTNNAFIPKLVQKLRSGALQLQDGVDQRQVKHRKDDHDGQRSDVHHQQVRALGLDVVLRPGSHLAGLVVSVGHGDDRLPGA